MGAAAPLPVTLAGEAVGERERGAGGTTGTLKVAPRERRGSERR
jgi:hypothetical protein